jgi:hypothetical protein
MGLFDKFFTEKTEATATSYVPQDEAEACLAILYIVSSVDGVSSVQEAENLLGNLTVKRRFFGVEWRDTMKRVVTARGETDQVDMLDAACLFIPSDFKPTIFALAADLILIDDEIDAGEEKLLAHISRQLKLEDELAQKIVDVMVLKNFDTMKLE